MTPRVRVFKATELGWQLVTSPSGYYVWEKPDGGLMAWHSGSEPEITIVDYDWPNYRYGPFGIPPDRVGRKEEYASCQKMIDMIWPGDKEMA